MLRKLYCEISLCRKCLDDVEIGREISATDKFLFLPPRVENGVPKYVFITMEPTDTWCDSREHGGKLLSGGMVNFYYSDKLQSRRGPMILQFVAQAYLCGEGETYLITDLGKCSMPTDNKKKKMFTTGFTRERRFDNCKNWLKEELDIVKPKRIFLVGGSVEDKINKIPWYIDIKSKCNKIYHYSGSNNPRFDTYCNNNKDDFREFKNAHSDMQSRFEDFINKRKSEIKNDGSVIPGSEAHCRLMQALNHITELTEGDRKIIYYYWSEFRK